MRYPKWLQKNDLIGIAAPSAGIDEKHREGFDLSLENLRRAGFRIRETQSVRSGLVPSAPPAVRAAEWESLERDGEVRLILCAAGGDFLYTMLPETDLSLLRDNPKWVQGYSDNTSLLFGVTTKYDVATIYGGNAGSFGMRALHASLQENIRLWKGELASQENYPLFERERADRLDGYRLTEPVEWKTPNGVVNVRGRLIGGCLDVLRYLVGTPYEATRDFVRRYRADGLIWYFDIFSMHAEDVYYTLLQLQAAGWFEGARGFLFGRVIYPGTMMDMSYEAAAVGALGREAAIVMEADVGHVNPRMTFVNGALARLTAGDGRGRLEYRFT